MNEITYREATSKDVKELSNLWKKLSLVHETMDEYWVMQKGASNIWQNNLQKEIHSKGTSLIMANNGEKVIAFIRASIREDAVIFKRKICKISELFVENEYRNLGVAGQLLARVEEFAKKNKAKYLVEQNGLANDPARWFYKHAGLKAISEMRVKKL